MQTEEEIEGGAGDEEEEEKEDTSGPDFNYLLSMPMWFLTKEKKEELCRQRDAKVCVLKGSDVVELLMGSCVELRVLLLEKLSETQENHNFYY